MDLLDVTIAKSALSRLQDKLGGAYVSESAWVQRMGELRIAEIGAVISYLVDRNEVESFHRFAAADCPGMYRVR